MKSPKSGKLALRVSKQMRGRIEAVATASRWSMSVVVEVCVENFLPELEKEIAAGIVRHAVYVAKSADASKKLSKK